jgi:hypothetical protein
LSLSSANEEMTISILCLLPFGIAAAANLQRLRGDSATLVADTANIRASVAHSDRNEPQMFKLLLNNHKGVQYTAPVTLGNLELMAVYDTGSFEIMAISRQCKACNLPSSLNRYDNSSSTSFVAGNRPIENHHFAGGLVVARQDYETVHVGTMESVFQVKNMPFWQVVDTDMAVWMNKKASFNAIVGLGHRGAVPDTPEDRKPADSLIERTGTQRFAICLVRGPSNPGYLVFNPAYDFRSTNFASMFRRIAVIGQHHWAIKLNSVTAVQGDKKQSQCDGDQPCVAIIDSGTSLIGVPPSAVNMVYGLIQQVQYDCSNLDTLPDLVFELDGQKFAMPAAAYTVQFGQKDGKPERCLPAFTDFAMTSDKGTVWILGMPFLRHFYTVFDRQEPAIYVADQGEDCEPAAARNATDVNSTFFNATGMHKTSTQVTVADISEARLPSWAYAGQKYMTV